MAKVEKTPAEWAKWIDEMYASAPNPAAIPALVEDLITAARDLGHDAGVESVAAYLDDAAVACHDNEFRTVVRGFAMHARTLKKGGA